MTGRTTKCKPAVCTAAIVLGAIGAVVYGTRFIFEVVSLLAAAVPFACSLGIVLLAYAARTNQRPKAVVANIIKRVERHRAHTSPTA